MLKKKFRSIPSHIWFALAFLIFLKALAPSIVRHWEWWWWCGKTRHVAPSSPIDNEWAWFKDQKILFIKNPKKKIILHHKILLSADSLCRKFLLPNSFSFNPNPIFQIAKWALSVCALTKQKKEKTVFLSQINRDKWWGEILFSFIKKGEVFSKDPEP